MKSFVTNHPGNAKDQLLPRHHAHTLLLCPPGILGGQGGAGGGRSGSSPAQTFQEIKTSLSGLI